MVLLFFALNRVHVFNYYAWRHGTLTQEKQSTLIARYIYVFLLPSDLMLTLCNWGLISPFARGPVANFGTATLSLIMVRDWFENVSLDLSRY